MAKRKGQKITWALISCIIAILGLIAVSYYDFSRITGAFISAPQIIALKYALIAVLAYSLMVFRSAEQRRKKEAPFKNDINEVKSYLEKGNKPYAWAYLETILYKRFGFKKKYSEQDPDLVEAAQHIKGLGILEERKKTPEGECGHINEGVREIDYVIKTIHDIKGHVLQNIDLDKRKEILFEIYKNKANTEEEINKILKKILKNRNLVREAGRDYHAYITGESI